MNAASWRKTSIQTMILSSCKTAFHHMHRGKATQNFLRDNTPDFISSQEWTPHLPNLNPLDYSVWDILQELVYKGRREPICESQRSPECYQRQMARYRWPEIQKSYIAVEKAFSSCGKAEWRTYSVHFLLISWLIRITMTVWRSGVACLQPTTQMTNCLQTLFYDVHYYFACITANMEAL